MYKYLILFFLLPILSVAQEDKGFEKAFKAYDKGDYEKALDLFNKIEESQSSNAEFFLFRGICFSETGNDVKAIADYNLAIEIDNEYPEAYNQRGFSFFSQGNDSLAIKDFDRAIELNPEMVEIYMNRGSAKYDAGDTKGACEDWKTAKVKGLGIADQLIEQLCK
ncbi:tetratricopeptide repeat protein [Reichenbachiella sp. MALMAid0571]|uniref:tetratricopeptide repeat protein n=1 Tax=Reichenbachiella sp. MALMAid0571 TaxID=3143939 RepID=UPI0032DEC17B